MTQSLLRMQNISKRFPGVTALEDVSLVVQKGEVHGLLGENGAGKSTLMKILSGVYQPTSGSIEFEGQKVELKRPQEAQSLGITTIYQEFNLIPTLSVAENIFIGREPGPGGLVNWAELRKQAGKVLDHLNIRMDPMKRVQSLSVADQQMVEIARALSVNSKLIVMDEPTAALTERETSRLLEIIRDLRRQQISVIFISHHLQEAKEICDRVTVLRDGQFVACEHINDVSTDEMVRLMVGRDAADLFTRRNRSVQPDVLLSVRHLERASQASVGLSALHDISFDVHRGEILGVAGLIGAGRTEVMRTIFGADPYDSGEMLLEGKPFAASTPREAVRLGIGLVPEDRKGQALFLTLAVRENLSMAKLSQLTRIGGLLKFRDERRLMNDYRERLNIRMSHGEQRIINLSGGNQQKVVIARWMALKPRLLIVDEPTRGIDIAAKAEVHQLLHELASQGVGIIMVSSELPEVLSVSDRILIMREGRVSAVLSQGASEEAVMQHMTLLTDMQAVPTHEREGF